MITSVPRLELAGLSRSFPGVIANDDVSLAVKPGEIHALLGENGAGKSTLVKMIYGVLKPDAGTILWNGDAVSIATPKAARHLGIGMVFQHFSLFDALTVLENIALGLDVALPRRDLEARVRDILDTYHLPLDPHRAVHTLSVGERQRIEIVRALLAKPKLLIMDEPTSVLTPQEVERLFQTLRQLAADGCSILYISHKLEEIRQLCDTATILRGGRVVGACEPANTPARTLAELMIGTELGHVERPQNKVFGPARLRVSNLSVPADTAFGRPLDDIAFSVRNGEIFGIAGVAGNGQNTLFAALSGERRSAANTVTLDGIAIGALDAGRRRKAGLGAVPEERNGHAAVPELSLWENVVLAARDQLSLTRRGLIAARPAQAFARKIIERFNVKATGPDAAASSLSGGNLQKFIMGRDIMLSPKAMIVSQPTWGVDAGAAAAIHQALIDLAAQGTAIVLISQDLDELLALADRMAVINEGRLSTPMDVPGISIDHVGLLMGGIHGETATDEAA